jgi:peptidoglycan/xylan/chitin deacetylase (PgdA/CDA1 family)
MPFKHQPLPALLAITLLAACGQGAGGEAEATDAAPAAATTISSNQTGTDGGMFYSFWKTSNGSASMTLDGSNGYSVSWSNIGDITCGKGWSTGSGHTVTFSGSHNNSGGGGFGIYGWTKNPLIEYYITEQPGQQGASSGDQVGTFTSDGSTYVIRKHQQVNQPCITGNSCTFWQYISVRQSPRTSGVITIQNHFNAWKNLGLNLGSHDYQILLTESWNGSGNGSGKISEGGNSSSSSSSSGGTSSSGGSSSCKGYVGISFDDGPGSNTTALISALKSAGLTPVTFFNIGQNVAANSSLVAQEKAVGEVQNHSYTHQHMTSWSQSQVYDELNRTNQAIQNAGAPKPTLFRLPYGESSSAIQAAASQAGVRAMTWDVDSQDWNGASTSAIVNAANQLQNGQVILMHDAYPNTTNQAISQIAANLKSKGLCPGRIDPSTGKAVAPSGSSSGGGSSSSSGGSTGSCYVTGSAGSSGNGWYNLNLTVSGASSWTVTANMAGNSKVSATWNVSASYPSASQLVAKSNGSGNSWGMTITTNGTWTWPTFSCVPN